MNEIAKAIQDEMTNEKPITKMGKMLLDSGKINSSDFKSILETQAVRGLRFGDTAFELGLVKAADINEVLAQQFAYPVGPDASSKLDSRLFAAFHPDSVQTEALRSLRSELQLRYFNHKAHLNLALVSAEDATNIALTAANLAIVFAQSGIRTLLVDSNLRAPQLHKLFGLSHRTPGLADLIARRVRPEPMAIEELGTLWVLPAGTQAPNPQELLSRQDYGKCMLALSESFDVILISTTPLNHTLDAQLVATQAGAALLVLQEDVSRLKDAEAICNNLRGFGVRLLGAAVRK